MDESRMEVEREPSLIQKYPWIAEVPNKLKPLLNKMIGNLPNFYFAVQKKGFYIPDEKSKAINGEYL